MPEQSRPRWRDSQNWQRAVHYAKEDVRFELILGRMLAVLVVPVALWSFVSHVVALVATVPCVALAFWFLTRFRSYPVPPLRSRRPDREP